MNRSVIIVAAGTGSRMGSSVPKQFLLLNGVPIVMHSIRRFHSFDATIRIILVLASSEKERWKKLCSEHSFSIIHKVVDGGQSRFESVQNGLHEIHDGIVAIHDGVRPLVSNELISHCFSETERFSNAIPAVPIIDTIREATAGGNRIIDRTNLRSIQTPQCFDVIKLKEAFKAAGHSTFTDDAGVFENNGNRIHLVAGERSNIKITDATDLVVAEALLHR